MELKCKLMEERFHTLQAELDLTKLLMSQEIDKHKRECMYLKEQLRRVEEETKIYKQREAMDKERIINLLEKIERMEKVFAEKFVGIQMRNLDGDVCNIRSPEEANLPNSLVLDHNKVFNKDCQAKRKRDQTVEVSRPYMGQLTTTNQQIRAQKKAEKLQQSLKSCKSFIKTMTQSNVAYCFSLNIPTKFCKENFSHEDKVTMMKLEGEDGLEYELKCLSTDHPGQNHSKCIFSGGWVYFAKNHGLETGDVLIFELIEATRFKVHIIKANQEINEEGLDDISLPIRVMGNLETGT